MDCSELRPREARDAQERLEKIAKELDELMPELNYLKETVKSLSFLRPIISALRTRIQALTAEQNYLAELF